MCPDLLQEGGYSGGKDLSSPRCSLKLRGKAGQGLELSFQGLRNVHDERRRRGIFPKARGVDHLERAKGLSFTREILEPGQESGRGHQPRGRSMIGVTACLPVGDYDPRTKASEDSSELASGFMAVFKPSIWETGLLSMMHAKDSRGRLGFQCPQLRRPPTPHFSPGEIHDADSFTAIHTDCEGSSAKEFCIIWVGKDGEDIEVRVQCGCHRRYALGCELFKAKGVDRGHPSCS
jgi:hypothetical protein